MEEGKRRLLIAGITVFLMATSVLGFIVGGSQQPKSFQYEGRCLATIVKEDNSQWLVYTLKDVNIPGERKGSYIVTVPTEQVKKIVLGSGLLYWKSALVSAKVEGVNVKGKAFVLPERNVGDTVYLNCFVQVERGVPVVFDAIEIPST